MCIRDSPEAVGNTQRMLVSELAGKASLIAKAKNLGIDLAQHPDKTQEILDDIKRREAVGYSYEVADGSLALLLQWHLGAYRPHFTLCLLYTSTPLREWRDPIRRACRRSRGSFRLHGRRPLAPGRRAGCR